MADPSLVALERAAQHFVNSRADEPALMTSALLVWEQDTGDGKEIHYAVVTENYSPAAGLGLMVAGRAQIERDLGYHSGGDSTE